MATYNAHGTGGVATVRLGSPTTQDEVTARLGALTGSDSTEVVCWVPAEACTVKAVKLVDITGITGHTTNYATLTVYNRGSAGTGSTSVAARATSGTANTITAKSAWDVTVSTTAANLVLAAGDCITAALTEAGTGQDLAGASLTLHYTRASNDEVVAFIPDAKVKILSVKLVNQAAITGNASNYGTLTVYNRGAAGTGTTAVAQRATDTATTDDVTANVPWEVTLSSTPAALYVEAGEALTCEWAQTGTGGDLTEASVMIAYVYHTGQEV
jgi:hypothetical protein